MQLEVVIEAGDDGRFIAHAPALPGCRSQGATRAEALANIREATEAWVEVQQDKAERAGKPADIELVTP